MDFLHRNANNQPQTTRSTGSQNSSPVSVAGAVKNNLRDDHPKWLRVSLMVLLYSIAALAVAIALLFYFGKDKEADLVDTSKQQAVFLTNGQVYFGRLTQLNDDFVRMEGIYYLNSQQQPSADQKATTQATTSFSLVKLGCELHGPTDQMVINREQVSFWENLKSDGKVAKAIEEWVKQNPNGQNCAETSSSTNQSTTDSNTNTTKKQ